MPFCVTCGKLNAESAKFCTGCGAPVSTNAPRQIQAIPGNQGKKDKLRMLLGAAAFLIVSVAAYFLFFNKKKDNLIVQPESGMVQAVPGKYPDGSQRLLTYEDIRNLSQYNLRIMRNEIYARHGFIFQNTEMYNYFSSQSWYSARYNDISGMLSSIEKTNIVFIKKYEHDAVE